MNLSELNLTEWASLTETDRETLLERPTAKSQDRLKTRVAEILSEVKADKDAALFRLTRELDRVELESLEVSAAEKVAAEQKLTPQAKKDLARAKDQIATFHKALSPQSMRLEVSPGVVCSREARALEKVGLYIPGGSAPLPSTVLMLGVPSEIAGNSLRILCTPPNSRGEIDPHILFAASLCGIPRIFKLGGAQAIAAMAFGTQSVPKVDKIFGPGNSWVTEAKAQVAFDPRGAAIDMPAGPSEVLVIGDENASPEFIASDLLSQAEHGPDSQVILVSPSRKLLQETILETERQLARLSRNSIATLSLRHSRFILTHDLKTALDVANRYAPEHLLLQVENPENYRSQIQNAGSVFLGRYSPEAMGDYASGTNHVLPTYGYARAYSGVSIDSFFKQITFQSLSPEGLKDLGPVVERLALLEGLDAHKNAITVRLNQIERERR